jgi:phage tail-like protein
MALTKDQIKTTYPLPVYNYRVEINGTTVGFSEVSGLSIAYETTSYAESPIGSGSPAPLRMHMPAQSKVVNIVLKKGVVPGVSIQTLYDWIHSIQTNRVDKKDIYVRLCDEEGKAVISWKVINAFPTKLDAPTFTASSNDAAVESMELMADGILIEKA